MTLLLLATFATLLLLGVPVALTMGIASLVTTLASDTLRPILLPQYLFSGINSFPLMAVPLFILAADLMTAGKLTGALLGFSRALVGHLSGGLGHVNILASMLFAGKSGSALADAAGPGAIALNLMRQAGYPRYYAGALTATSAVIGPIIPPSIVMVVYAVTDHRVTVAGLFAAGIFPGILLGMALAIANHVISKRKSFERASRRASIGEIARTFVQALPGLMMPVILLGGILSGMFTVTEAAAIAVLYALVVSLAMRGLKVQELPRIFLGSAMLTSAVLLIVSMASIFAHLLTIMQVPQVLAAWMTGLTEERALVLIILAVFVLICGLFIDTLPAVIILTPILSPVAAQFGIDPLHFATIFILSLVLGMVTPPVGPVLFVVSAVGKLKLERLATAVLPLLLAQLIVLALVIAFPAVSLSMPALFGYTR